MSVEVQKPRSDFTTSSGVVASDRLQREIDEDATITSACEAIVPMMSDILFCFSTALSGAEETALDTIITNHSGVGLPDDPHRTSHVIGSASVATLTPSFVDETHSTIGAIGLNEQRLALGDGLLQTVGVRSDQSSGSVTVQLVINGSAVGSGKNESITANTLKIFTLPLADSEYVEGNLIGIAITGLIAASATRLEAVWREMN